MPYTIKPKTDGFGSISVLVGDAREALEIVKGMAERGVEEIEVFDVAEPHLTWRSCTTLPTKAS